MGKNLSYNPFRFSIEDLPFAGVKKTLLRPALPALSWATGLSGLADVYDKIVETLQPNESFAAGTLRVLGVDFKISQTELDRIPKTGPVVVVANHPFGGLEGVILVELLRRARPDAKVMANFMLGRIPELRKEFIFVDPFGSKSAARANIGPLRETVDWLKQGKIAGVFPSGTVSHLHLRGMEVRDPEWSSTVARMITQSKATVVPIFFEGRNDAFFQLMGLTHPMARTLMLPRQLLNKKGTVVTTHIGKPITYEKLSSFNSRDDMLSYLRMRTYIMKNRGPEKSSKFHSLGRLKRKQLAELEPIAAPTPPALVEQDFEQLPADQILHETEQFTVAYAYSTQIPHILREIGRLREVTFRQAQEGTGRSIDLDRFDEHYIHLFLWDREKKELAGAYRLGRTDVILERFGLKGLYTRTLFGFPESLLKQIGPCLELGRSFIRQEYQKNYWSLMLLWKGIGRYVSLHPQYCRLFGPVSINSEYRSVSHQLIATFLRLNTFEEQLARLIKPKNPIKKSPIRGIDQQSLSTVVRDIDEVSDLIDEIEARGHGVPVLLKQYLKLGGKLLGFSVDPSFGSVMDGLILVDLLETDRRLLTRYLGKEGAERIHAYNNSLTAEEKKISNENNK